MMLAAASATIESDLRARRLACPACPSGQLRPWGFARARSVRACGFARLSVRPRRARCDACKVTQVVVPSDVIPRRSFTLDALVEALDAHRLGVSRARVALMLGVSVGTTQRLLGRLKRDTGRLCAAAWRLTQQCDPLASASSELPTGPFADLLDAFGHALVAVRHRLGPTVDPTRVFGVWVATDILTVART